MKLFLKAIIQEFEIGPEAAHVALVSYSSRPRAILKFNDLSGKFLTQANIFKRIENMPHQRGFTYIDRALRMAEREIFITMNGMRSQDVAKVCA